MPTPTPGRRLAAAAAAIAAALLAAGPVRAIGSASNDDASIEAVGSVRLLAGYLHYPDVPEFFPPGDDGLAGAVTRLILDGDLGEHVDYETNLYLDMSRMPQVDLGGSVVTAGTYDSPYRTRYLSWSFWESGAVDSEMGVDRLAFRLLVDRYSLTVGRFAINHSVTHIFTPNDFFAPFTASSINKEYKPGVDGLRFAVSLGMLSSLELDAVMGYGEDGVPSWGRSAAILRASTVQWNVQWALLGGKVADRWMVGASLQGDVDKLTFRAEAHAGFPDEDGDGLLDRDRSIHGRLSAGMGVLIPWHNFSINVEYMFVSDGAGRTHDYIERYMELYPDGQPYVGRHYAGLSFSGEIIPILTFNTVGLFNILDTSGLAALMLDLSIADEAELVAGVLVPWGEDPVADSGPPYHAPRIRSEFGMMPLMAFFETRVYF